MVVAAELRRMIDEDEFAPSGRMPSERALAVRLGVSRTVLRNALAELEVEGKIWRQQGRGTYVGEPQAPPPGRLPKIAKMTNPAEVMEVRRIIEPRIAMLAALRASSVEIAEMERCVAKGNEAVDTESFERWDGRFHRAMAAAARNSFLLAIFDEVNGIRRDKLWGRLKEATLNNTRRAAYSEQHRDIVAMIRDRDAAGAESAMSQHLDSVQRGLLGI
jgi:DNA-binding FadR family transcriptional regulator